MSLDKTPQISRLRSRLKNVGKNTVEYRMTVQEARALLAEIDNLEKLSSAPPVVEIKTVVQPPTVTRILDGGTF